VVQGVDYDRVRTAWGVFPEIPDHESEKEFQHDYEKGY
jgi:hypothetical protein